jgi:hypothetical protein
MPIPLLLLYRSHMHVHTGERGRMVWANMGMFACGYQYLLVTINVVMALLITFHIRAFG